ncbi:hypothetical protein Rsub_03157 [Raphidocelis subcapitata]|uniref:CAAX prenyl protease 2/Lysostaphin resistance protein A-like domain-containing protein n=1 Tax=Raphidocelis subcapitata TaxID=307507 RepID=A0A2V0P0H3_9CHLO|nr:hypothetical protein Rsub_03157 [Raphidocelis subcapitata]|eukprot:GBF90585.1 hypothetical protein Rsub_03157 [Raphidocelis subcapitata]
MLLRQQAARGAGTTPGSAATRPRRRGAPCQAAPPTPEGPSSGDRSRRDEPSNSTSTSSGSGQQQAVPVPTGSAPPAAAAAAEAASTAPAPLWEVPWDAFEVARTAAVVWLVDQTAPTAIVSAAARLQGLPIDGLRATEKELLLLAAQVVQLAATAAILRAAAAPHAPLPPNWFSLRADAYGLMLAPAAAISAAGGGILLVSALSGMQADGVREWGQVVSVESEGAATAALAIGAVVLAPLSEELFFRGFLLPALTKWMPTAAAVGVSAALFAAAHPPGAFLPELLLGAVLGAACVAAGGSLLTPLLAHAAYNGLIVAAALALAAGGGGGGGGMPAS